MNEYRYRAHSPEGTRFSGVIAAGTPEEARRTLLQRGLVPDGVRPARRLRLGRFTRRPAWRELVQFSRQFAALVGAGIPLLASLDILRSLADDPVIRDALEAMSRDVASGSGLAESMRHHPRVFGEIYVAVVAAGEQGGSLDEALEQMAEHMERMHEVREGIRGAMVYPLVIGAVSTASVVALLAFVVPAFDDMFDSAGLTLPLVTRLLIGTSNLLADHVALLVALVVSLALGGRALARTAGGRRALHRVVLRLPWVGRLARKAAVARLSRTMRSLIHSGVPLLEALETSGRTSGNALVEMGMARVRNEVAAGSPLAPALGRHPIMPALVAQMVGVGEQTGRLAEMFDKVADFFERDVRVEVQGLLKALEPALVVLVGIVLGVMIIATYLPIFDAAGAIGPP